MTRQTLNTSRFLLLGIILLAQLGCAGKNLLNWKHNEVPEADARNPVRKIVCIWEPVEGQGLDGLPTRGFAGQIMFFTHASPLPATSDGEVRVTVYHDCGTHEEQVKPLHQFDFPGNAWATHLQESTPGPSYRIFIPYTAKHHWETNCALRVRLTAPDNGPTVYSEMVYVRLPGPVQKKADKDTTAKPQPKLPGRSAELSDFQFGATLNHSDGVAGTGGATAAPSQASLSDSGLHVTTPDQPKSAGPTKALGPIQLTSAQQLAQPLQKPAPDADEEAKIRHFEQMLRQLKQKQRQKRKRSVVPDVAPVKLPEQKRFRLSPTPSNSVNDNHDTVESSAQRDATKVHPLDESESVPHPLEGF